MKILNQFLISLIKLYRYFISPLFPSSCRYIPSCSEYFIDCLKYNGLFKSFYLGTKRILSCHPIKILGGKSGFDPAPNPKKENE
tara:strand:- start:232 stop:483 length:252 start_codon:yes stop_codon:yes gene_type:complete